MIKKRLFTFGCSHTYYYWPSWANILSLGADEFYNFGWPGTGDFRILNQVMRANERFKFGKNDYIGIGMSCNHRYDTIDKRGRTWVGLGGMADMLQFLTNQPATRQRKRACCLSANEAHAS